jgi:hypothetical protein
MDTQLFLDGLFNPTHIFLRKNPGSSKKPQLSNSRQLIRHSFAFFAFKDQ